jgi:3-hydroxyacyl-[acyl-carrier-protein] dehydratase
MTAERIEAAIPHRLPMRLLDEIVEESDGHIICRKTFKADDFFVQGHFPDYPLVPGVIQCECCLQAGAIVLSRHTPQSGVVPVATRMDNVKFKRMVRPGDTVQIEVTLNENVGKAYFLTGKVTLDGKLAARLDFACSIADPRESSGSTSGEAATGATGP